MRFFVDVIRALIRIIALPFILLGLMALGFAAAVFTSADALAGIKLGQVWFQHDPFQFLQKGPSIQLVQVVVERKLNYPPLWNPGITTILNWPAGNALLAVGGGSLLIAFILFALTRRPVERRSAPHLVSHD